VKKRQERPEDGGGPGATASASHLATCTQRKSELDHQSLASSCWVDWVWRGGPKIVFSQPLQRLLSLAGSSSGSCKNQDGAWLAAHDTCIKLPFRCCSPHANGRVCLRTRVLGDHVNVVYLACIPDDRRRSPPPTGEKGFMHGVVVSSPSVAGVRSFCSFWCAR
jgi:hypothetical protein